MTYRNPTIEQVRQAVENNRCEVRTGKGAWRFVCAVYSDGTLGTVRAEGNSSAGRFTTVDMAAVRELVTLDD